MDFKRVKESSRRSVEDREYLRRCVFEIYLLEEISQPNRTAECTSEEA